MKINLRKIGTAALACILSLSSAAAAVSVYNGSGDIFSKVSAAQQGHITINAHTGDNGKVQSLAGKKFNVYKVFDALNSDGMESINYTINPLYVQALKNATKKDSEYAIIDYIQSMNNNLVTNDVNHNQKNETVYSDFRYFVESLRNEIVRLGNKPTQIVTVPEGTEESYTLDVDYGWYLIDEVTNVEGTHSAASLCMVNTANPDMTVDIKSDFPVIQKQIQEDDNRKNIGINSDGWNDVADFEIGQTVPYRYNSYVPDMNGYDTYYYAVHDKMNSALTFVPDSVKVKIGSMTLQKDTDYRVVTEGIDDGETFQIQIMDLKAVINRYYYSGEAGNKPETEKVYGQKILIEYDAVLNEDAQLDTGRPGFENDVKLEYSNNPDADGAGQTGETPWDTVVCFTFRMDGIKVNDQVPERKLEGAKFKLYSDKDCTQEVYVKKAFKSDGYTVISRDSVAGSASPSEAVEIVSDENGAFNIIGLDSQVYFFKETKAPDGYRLLKDPIEIDVKAVYGADNRTEYIKGDGATDKTLRSLEATAKFKEFYTGVHSEYEKSLSTNVDTGTLNIKVVNKVGSKLPATGSAATIVLVCAGTAVMAAVLIKKKKKNSLFKFLKKDIVIFMTGLALVSYPVISNCIESKSQTGQIATYKEKTTDTAAEDKRCMIEDAEKWNTELYMNQKGIPASREFKYEDILDIGNGMIGSIEIPCINVNMPIYHGTSDSVLSTGAGHIQDSSFPTGGKNTHAALTGHRGLPSSRLFTRLDELKTGDLFYINVLDETMAYKISRIETVLPEKVNYSIQDDKDLVSLITCTPYGLNTHRLVVTGYRISYKESVKKEIKKNIISFREFVFYSLPVVFSAAGIFVFRKKERKGDRGCEK